MKRVKLFFKRFKRAWKKNEIPETKAFVFFVLLMVLLISTVISAIKVDRFNREYAETHSEELAKYYEQIGIDFSNYQNGRWGSI